MGNDDMSLIATLHTLISIHFAWTDYFNRTNFFVST